MINKPVLLFDGVCNMCNATVQRVLLHDRSQKIQFAALQSDAGRQLLAEYGLDKVYLDSLVYIEHGKVYTHSTGALRLAKQMGGAYQFLYIFIIVPAFVRDAVYRFVARNRYSWFGRRESCMLPRAEWRERFL